MKKFSKIFFYLTAVVLLSWLLPWLLQFAASKPGNDPFTLYSCVTKRFAYIQSSKDNGVKRYDANGTEYTVAQFDSILPTFYYRQLFSKDRLPDTINGKEVTPKIIAHGNFTFGPRRECDEARIEHDYGIDAGPDRPRKPHRSFPHDRSYHFHRYAGQHGQRKKIGFVRQSYETKRV